MQRFLYKIRQVSGGRSARGEKYVNHSLTVPPDVAKATPEGTMFEFRADEEGFHYVRVVDEEPNPLPSWAKNNGAESEPKRARPRPTATT